MSDICVNFPSVVDFRQLLWLTLLSYRSGNGQRLNLPDIYRLANRCRRYGSESRDESGRRCRRHRNYSENTPRHTITSRSSVSRNDTLSRWHRDLTGSIRHKTHSRSYTDRAVGYFVFALYGPNQRAPVLGVRRAAYASWIQHSLSITKGIVDSLR